MIESRRAPRAALWLGAEVWITTYVWSTPGDVGDHWGSNLADLEGYDRSSFSAEMDGSMCARERGRERHECISHDGTTNGPSRSWKTSPEQG
jgi:hypothetical protein